MIPLAYFLAFTLNYDIIGIMVAVVTSIFIASGVLCLRYR